MLMEVQIAHIPLIFSAKSKNIHQYEGYPNRHQIKFARARKKAFIRDNYVCQCCDFHDKSNQQLHYLDNDFSNINLDNLVTICPLCSQTFRINDLSRRKSSILIWLPEISQANLNNLIRAMLIVKYQNSTELLAMPVKDTESIDSSLHLAMEEIITLFQFRIGKAKTKIRTNDPYILARALLSLPKTDYELRDQFLTALRILPSEVLTPTCNPATKIIVDSWFSKTGPFFGLMPATWQNLYQPILNPNSMINAGDHQ